VYHGGCKRLTWLAGYIIAGVYLPVRTWRSRLLPTGRLISALQVDIKNILVHRVIRPILAWLG